MNKFRLIYLLFFFFLVFKINAQDFRFNWNIGSFNIYGDTLNNTFNGDFNILHFNCIIHKLSIGINILDIYDYNNIDNNGITKFSILPVKLSYIPLNYNDLIFLSVYGKAGWQMTGTRNDNNLNHDIYGSLGIQLFFFPEWDFFYSPYYSLFFEYDTHKKLKIGLSLDLGLVTYYVLKSWART
jgi:hypothetical protein